MKWEEVDRIGVLMLHAAGRVSVTSMISEAQSSGGFQGGSAPRVSLGLPVRNGERFLPSALDALLAQTYGDFELVISDNASTDRTPEICRAYAARDGRIRYERSEVNRGAAPNFNRVFELSRGELFRWTAHDDLVSPNLLGCCVAALDRRPEAVLANPGVKVIDEGGEEVEEFRHRLPTDSPDACVRFRCLLKGHRCYQIFGLIRRAALAKTDLLAGYANCDGVLLARLGLEGVFVEVPEAVFYPRRHPGQSMYMFGCYDRGMPDYHRWTAWFSPRMEGKIVFPYWRMGGGYFSEVFGARINWRQRWRCVKQVGRWFWRGRARLAQDLRVAAGRVWGDLTAKSAKDTKCI